MKKVLAFVAVAGMASAAVAQDGLSWSASAANPLNALNVGDVVSFTVSGSFDPAGDTRGIAGYDGDVAATGGSLGGYANGGLDAGFFVNAGNNVVAGQLPQIINPAFVTSNPVVLFTFDWTATAEGTFDVSTATNQFKAYVGGNGASRDVSYTDLAQSLTVVPAPSSLALVGLGGLVATRRRR